MNDFMSNRNDIHQIYFQYLLTFSTENADRTNTNDINFIVNNVYDFYFLECVILCDEMLLN